MSKNNFTKEELLETIKRSSLPTVLVEGDDDIIFYRRIEQEFGNFKISILPAGGKQAVLWLKNKLDENPVDIQVAYIVDQDDWVNFGIPDDISDVITTCGYSVENDLYTDGNLEELLLDNEINIFKNELEKFVFWYALALFRHKQNSNNNCSLSEYKKHPNEILDNDYNKQISLYEGEVYPEEFRQNIEDNYKLKLRGKSLISLLMRRLSHNARIPKYSRTQLMDMAASRKGENYIRLVGILKDKFNI